MLVKIWSNWNCIASGSINWWSFFGKLALSSKNNVLLNLYPKKMSILVYKNVHSSVIRNSPKVETNPMSINNCMDKLFVVVFIQWDTIQQWKRMNYYYIAIIWVNLMSMMLKETSHHRVCSIWFSLYEIQNQARVICGDR